MTPSAVVSEKLPLLSSSDTATSHPEAPAEGFLWALSSSAQLSGQQREILRSAQNDTFSCSLRKAAVAVILRHSYVSSWGSCRRSSLGSFRVVSAIERTAKRDSSLRSE